MNRPEDWDLLLASIDDLLAKANEMTREQARAALKNVVPEFQFESPLAPRSPNADSSPATSGGPSVADVAAAPG